MHKSLWLSFLFFLNEILIQHVISVHYHLSPGETDLKKKKEEKKMGIQSLQAGQQDPASKKKITF